MTKNQNAFRFTDEHLQSLLLEAIKSAGFTCQIAEDGTVLYSPGYSIENIIDQIVRTIFPQSYYRTEISDSVKAARYRRFKQFNGTRFVEESRNGQTYFVQEIYEKLYRNGGIPTNVSFVLADESLDPDRVTALLGISPTFACLKGGPFTRPYTHRRKDAPPHPSNKGWWELCSIPQVESNAVVLHLEWLLRMLEPVTSMLESLAKETTAKDFRILQVFVVEPHGIGGVSLSSRLLEQLGVLTDRVDIGFWPDDYI